MKQNIDVKHALSFCTYIYLVRIRQRHSVLNGIGAGMNNGLRYCRDSSGAVQITSFVCLHPFIQYREREKTDATIVVEQFCFIRKDTEVQAAAATLPSYCS